MRQPTTRDQYRLYNRRIVLFLFVGVSAGACGISIFCAIADSQMLEKYRDGPTKVTAAELFANPPETDAYLEVTDFELGDRFTMHRSRSESTTTWLVASPRGQFGVNRPNNHPPAWLFLVRFERDVSDQELLDLERNNALFIRVREPGGGIGWNTRRMIQRRYPGSDIDNAMTADEFHLDINPDSPLILTVSAGVSLLMLCVFATLLALTFRQRRVKPPPLPWDRPLSE